MLKRVALIAFILCAVHGGFETCHRIGRYREFQNFRRECSLRRGHLVETSIGSWYCVRQRPHVDR